jgi:pimeloyl-ACP methyl ester carboxylesterase
LRLASGAEGRATNAGAATAVVCVNGGQGNEVPGTWSATLEWLVRRLAPRRPKLGFLEVRYRIKSWRVLDLCIEDCRAAIDASGAERVLLLGFSMGGAVAIASAGDPRVTGVLGLAPWIPDRLDVSPLRGKRLEVLHGSLDRWLPGVPGVSPALSRRGFERAQALGVPGSYALIRGGVHGVAVRGPGDRLVALPRAREWARLVELLLEPAAP